MLAILAEAELALQQLDADSVKKLALIRWQLTRTLRSYQLFKHLEIFDPIISGGPPGASLLARSMKERCFAVGHAFEDHVRRWSSGNVEADWQTYESESFGFLKRLRSHLEREHSELDRLLTGIEEVRHSRRHMLSASPDRPG